MAQENNTNLRIEQQAPNVKRILLGFSSDNNVIVNKHQKREYSLAYGSCEKSSFCNTLVNGFNEFDRLLSDEELIKTIEVNIDNYYTSHYISNKNGVGNVNTYNIYILSSTDNIDTNAIFDLNNIETEYKAFYSSLLQKYSVTTNDINEYTKEINDQLVKDKNNYGSNVYVIIDNLQYIDDNFKYILFDQIHDIPIFSNDLSNTYHILKSLLNLSDDDIYSIMPVDVENETEITKWIYDENGELEPHIYIDIPQMIQRVKEYTK